MNTPNTKLSKAATEALNQAIKRSRLVFNGMNHDLFPIFVAGVHSPVIVVDVKDIVIEDTLLENNKQLMVPKIHPDNNVLDDQEVAVTMFENRYYVLSGMNKVRQAVANDDLVIKAIRISNVVMKNARVVVPSVTPPSTNSYSTYNTQSRSTKYNR
jgi:hypothetical protein